MAKLGVALECSVWFVFSSLMVTFLSFERLIRQLDLSEAPVLDLPDCTEQLRPSDTHIRRLGIYLDKISGVVTPRRPCLRSAVAGLLMLRRQGIRANILLGVRRSDANAMQAHAWLALENGEIVTGRSARDGFTPVTRLC